MLKRTSGTRRDVGRAASSTSTYALSSGSVLRARKVAPNALKGRDTARKGKASSSSRDRTGGAQKPSSSVDSAALPSAAADLTPCRRGRPAARDRIALLAHGHASDDFRDPASSPWPPT